MKMINKIHAMNILKNEIIKYDNFFWEWLYKQNDIYKKIFNIYADLKALISIEDYTEFFKKLKFLKRLLRRLHKEYKNVG